MHIALMPNSLVAVFDSYVFHVWIFQAFIPGFDTSVKRDFFILRVFAVGDA